MDRKHLSRSTYIVQSHGGLGECGKECSHLDVRVLLINNNEAGMHETRRDDRNMEMLTVSNSSRKAGFSLAGSEATSAVRERRVS